MFGREVRFYREVAPHVGVRVPQCLRADVAADGSTLLELEDLSDWDEGADAESAARLLGEMHAGWETRAVETWPWIVRRDAADLVEDLFASTWPVVRERQDVTGQTRLLGDRLLGRVLEADRQAEGAGIPTLTHGDASFDNMRTSAAGEIALLDWEDFGAGPGVCDLAWLLASSVEPSRWDAAIDAYGCPAAIQAALPAALVQALLSLDAEEVGSADAVEWIARVEEAGRRM
jgi:Ser/Thr protein kinase RdoA (MazF antagonist)